LHAAIVTRPPFLARTASGATREPREPTDPAGTGAFRRRADGVASLRSDIQERAEPRRDADAADSVARAAAGDVRAFEVLYHAHLSRVHSLVRRMTGGRDTDELTQDVFVRVWQKLSSFRGDSAFTTWLHRLTVNVVIERFRTEATRRQRMRDGEDIFETLPAPARSGDLSMDFETAMTQKYGNMQSSMVSQLSSRIQIFRRVVYSTAAHRNSSGYELEIAPYDQSKNCCESILPPSTPSGRILKSRI
jgi:RNA polymerase sigma factor (sigma-70 family)